MERASWFTKGQGTDIKTYVPTLKGTVTDIDGKYELSLEPDENAFTITYKLDL
ncbi:MAG: hypothetical protein IPO33_14605 [Saprospiraceae bacterium]|nr:hypothetical protein [Candidatus Brachybacter algidus]